MILAGDVGGTHTRLAFFDQSGEFAIRAEKKYKSREHASFAEIVCKFLAEHHQVVNSACFGLAGPVRNGICQATNLPWRISESELREEIGISSIRLLNDLEANAYGIEVLKPEEFYLLHPGQKQSGNRALIAAGTGLGEAGICWDGERYKPFACEGGHVDFAPRNQEEVALFLYLKKKFGHVSYERVVSGPGILAIYQFLIDTGLEISSKEVEEEMKRGDPSRTISQFARERKDSACYRAIDWFLSLYGAEAGNLALKFLSLGGLYIGGGIAPNLIEELKRGSFHASFVNKGRFNDLLQSIPIHIILNDNAALLGAASCARGL